MDTGFLLQISKKRVIKKKNEKYLIKNYFKESSTNQFKRTIMRKHIEIQSRNQKEIIHQKFKRVKKQTFYWKKRTNMNLKIQQKEEKTKRTCFQLDAKVCKNNQGIDVCLYDIFAPSQLYIGKFYHYFDDSIIKHLKKISYKQKMKPTQYRLHPEKQIPKVRLQELINYPELQRRVSSQQYQVSGVHNLIVELRKQTIEQLKEQFINNNNNVNLNQFMWLISNSMMVKNASFRQKTIEEQFYQYEVQYEIVKVFEEIDIDNSNSISWQQYLEYITSSSLMEINSNSDQQLSALAEQEKKTKELNFSHKQKTVFRKNGIRKIIQLQKLSMLVIVQKKSDFLNFLTINGGILPKPFQLNGVDHNKVLSIDYSDEDRMFGVLMNTHTVIFIEDGEMQKVHGENIFSGNQIQIMYLKRHKIWLLQSLDNSIQLFNPDKGRKKKYQSKLSTIKFKPHSDQLVGIRQLENPLSIITASRNGSLKIWSLTINQLLIELSPCKQDDFSQCKSIKGFQVYNNQLTSYIICWLFSPQISVWLPSSSLTKPYMGKLKGHIGIVQQAKFLANFPVVVSIDNKNSIRVWDVSKMQCIQNWKMETPFSAKIGVLKSLPYVMIYDKLIQFYKSTKQSSLIEFTNQKNSSMSMNKIKQESKSKKNNSFTEHERLQKKQRKRETILLELKKQDQVESDDGQIYQNYKKDKITLILQILYDNYNDCLILLTAETLSLLAINTGKLLNKVYAQSKSCFLAICLKQNRRLFLANNLGEVDCLKTQDCSSLYKLYPFKDIAENCKNLILKQYELQKQGFKSPKPKVQRPLKQSEGKDVIQYQIFGMNYNSYNGVLTVIGQSPVSSALVTYDNFSSLQPLKKKQVIFNQINLCSFVCSSKFNLFYIGSNRPQIITIWDFHNFVIIKSIHMPQPIVNISLQNQKYNFLAVIESHGVRMLRILPIEPKNMIRTSDSNFVINELYLKSSKRLQRGQFLYTKIQNRRKVKQNRVKFTDIEDNKKEPEIQIPVETERLELYILFGSNVITLNLQQLKDELPLVTEPSHNQKANITKQLKKINLNVQSCPPPKNTVTMFEIEQESLNSLKNTVILGHVNDLIFYQSNIGVISIYKPSEKKNLAKLSLPKCEVIQWHIFYNLADKLIARLKKAEQISRQIYAYKKIEIEEEEEHEHEDRTQHLRMAFILNKYFDQQDMNALRNYFENKKKNMKIPEKQMYYAIKKLENTEKMSKMNRFNNEINFFEQKFQQKHNRNKSVDKKIELEKSIKKTVNNYKIKLQEGQMLNGKTHTSNEKIKKVEGNTEENNSKVRSVSLKKMPENSAKKKLKSSISVFKIRNTASSINKMYCEHTKEIKSFLNKIGVLNNKIKHLKL